MPLDYRIELPPGGFVTLDGDLKRLADNLMLDVSDRAARTALRNIRADMAGARLGRLGNAVAMTSDKAKGRGVYRRGGVNRASGVIYIRSKSPRTVGAIISYTEGAQMAAKNPSGFMWYPLESAQRIIGKGANRKRLEPKFWKSSGLEAKLGPLFRIRGADGNPLLVVRNVAVGQVAGGRSKVKPRLKSGRAPKGSVLADIVPIFKGIKTTARAARVFPQRRAFEAAQQAAQELRGV